MDQKQPTEDDLIDCMYKDVMGLISKDELRSLIDHEKSLGVFNLEKALNAFYYGN